MDDLQPDRDAAGKRQKIASEWRVKSGYIFRNIPPGKYVVQAVLADHRHIVREGNIEVRPNEAATYEIVLNVGKVRFDASLSEGGPPFKGDLGWTVLGTKTDLAGKRKKLTDFWRVKSGQIFILPAGKWIVQGVLADWRFIRAEKTIEVEAGGGEAHAFNFNAGKVRFDASLSEGGPPFKGDLGWTVLGTKTDLAGKRKKITDFWRMKSGQVFILPAGKWIVQGVLADWRFIHTEKTIEVEAGGGAAHAFNFNAGKVRFDASLSKGGPPFKGDLGWTVLGTKTDLAGKRKKITDFWRVKSGQDFILPAGKWLVNGVLADHRHMRTAQTISVAPGSATSHAVVFGAGPVRVDVTVSGNPFKGEAGWTVYGPPANGLEKKRPKIMDAWRVHSGHIMILPEGKYLLNAVNADNSKQTGKIELTVTAGKAQSVTVDLTNE